MLRCPEPRCPGNQVGALGMHNVNTGSDVYARGCLAVAANGIQQGATTNIQKFPFPFLLHVKAQILTSLIDKEENGRDYLRIQTGKGGGEKGGEVK